jgi:2-alkenal reductase
MRRRTVWLPAALALVLLAGCGPVVGPPPPPTEQTAVEPTEPPSEAAQPPAETAQPEPEPTAAQLQSTDTVEREQAQNPPAPPAPNASASLSAVEVVDQVWPAVVTVVNERAAGPFEADGVQPAGRGTGFIIDEQGHIVTNEHVVSGSDQLEVIFSDGEKRGAELVGADPVSDLAVVRVDGELPAVVSFGNSEALEVGQPVLAIGSPLGEFSGTVTDGIVSALNRDFPGDIGSRAEYDNLIQHNAAINPGNSGGPLFDFQGQVIGVNTLGIPVTPDGAPVQGLFFAIPSNSVARIASQLIEHGRAIYPYFGAVPVEITPELAAQYDFPVDYGAYLVEVEPNTPAARAGIQADDIVTAIGDLPINAQRSFTEALFQFEPGQTVTVTVLRGTNEMTSEVTLGERTD